MAGLHFPYDAAGGNSSLTPKFSPRHEIEFRLGNAWFYQGKLSQAQSVLEQLEEADDLSPYLRQQVSIRLGTIFQLRQRHAEAIPFFEQALEGIAARHGLRPTANLMRSPGTPD